MSNLWISLMLIFTIILLSKSHPHQQGQPAANKENTGSHPEELGKSAAKKENTGSHPEEQGKPAASKENTESHSEEEKGKDNVDILETEMTQDKRSRKLLSSLSEYYIKKQLVKIVNTLKKKRPKYMKNNENQWVIATPLKIGLEDNGRLTVDHEIDEKDDGENEVYTNRDYGDEWLKATCKDTCEDGLNGLLTKMQSDKVLNEQFSNKVHTELQMLYRDDNFNLMDKETNKDKVILVYSYYIPCAQIQFENGGVFAECAGEMTAFRADPEKNKNNNYFIIIYESTDYLRTVATVSRLYMELGGIPSFHYRRKGDKRKNRKKNLYKDEHVLGFSKTYFIGKPVAIHFPRPLNNDKYKFSSTQLFTDCLARNSFLVADIETSFKEKFNTVIRYMYNDAREDLNKGYVALHRKIKKKLEPESHDYIIVVSCYKFTGYFEMDMYTADVISDDVRNHYYNYEGYHKETRRLPDTEQPAYQEMVNRLNKLFK